MKKKSKSKSVDGSKNLEEKSKSLEKKSKSVDGSKNLGVKNESLVKKSSSEIDEIFSLKKRKKVEEDEPVVVVSENAKKTKKVKVEKSKKVKAEVGFGNSDSKPRKKTNDNLRIYTEEELGINRPQSGGTRDCPFDCSCCF